MRKVTFLGFLALSALALGLFPACSSPYNGAEPGEMATFTINLGGNVTGRMVYGPDKPGYPDVEDLRFEVTFQRVDDAGNPTGAPIEFMHHGKDGGDTISGKIELGEYDISLEIYLSTTPYLYASNDPGFGGTPISKHEIIPGPNHIVISVGPNPNIEGTGLITDPFKVYDVATLLRVGKENAAGDTWTRAAHYVLVTDIVLPAPAPGDSNWAPIGTSLTQSFTGTFDGGGFTISNLTIIDSSGQYYGLFGIIGSLGTVKNLGLIDVDITITLDGDTVGGVAGYLDGGTVENCYTTGTVTGRDRVGGVVGSMNRPAALVENSYSTATVIARMSGGGVVGEISNVTPGATVRNCYSAGTVSAQNSGGGIVGANNGGTVENCVALNGSIISIATSTVFGRVAGNNPDPSGVDPHFLTDNYTWAGMEFIRNGNPETFPASTPSGSNGRDGANLSPNARTQAAWAAAFFDFSDSGPWVWNGGAGMPSLKGFSATPLPWPGYLMP